MPARAKQKEKPGSENVRAVIAAIVGNLGIAVTKLVAAAFSGSAAMLAEAIHSLVDTGNGTLMLYGMHRSRKPPDELHPLGHGHELYFWTLLVGVLIFGLGGGMSIVTGVVHILHRTPAENEWWSYAVLGVALVLESVSFYFGLRAFRAEQRERGIFESIRRTKNPMTFAVALEDTAALLGLVFALIGISLSSWLDAPWIDGASSVAIGVLLCVIAVIMVRESMGLLVGEGMEPDALRELRAIVERQPSVRRLASLLTLYLSPDEVLLVLELELSSNDSVAEMRDVLASIKRDIRSRFPRVRRVYFGTIDQSPP